MKRTAHNSGYLLLETIFYLLLFAVLSVTVVNSLITMTKAYKATAIEAQLFQGGMMMERMSREVRQAYAISSISANDLTLNSTDSAGANKTIRLALSGANLQLTENGTVTGNLNTTNVSVTGLTFTQITTVQGVAIKMVLIVKSNSDELARNESFYDTVVLRGDYE